MLGKLVAIVVAVFMLATLVSLGKLFEYNSLDSILVVQSVGGKVSVYSDPGYKPQNWGRVTHYRKSSILDFNSADSATPIHVQFAEGGNGDVNGSCRFDLPLDYARMRDIHQTFGSQSAVEKQLVRSTVERSMYMTGPLMTSTESFSVRKQDLINLFEDQARFGVFRTNQITREIIDPISQEKKWINALELKRDKDGNVERQEESPLVRFGVKLYNVSIVKIKYEDRVEKQIAQQQEASTAIQIAIANSKKAEQDAKTVEATGRAEAAKAKWAQEVIKATQTTLADQNKLVAETKANQEKVVAETAAQRDLNVATLNRQAAEQLKQKLILEGEGESAKRKMIMAADGALAAKLTTFREVNFKYAEALGNYRGNLVPTTVFASGAGTQGNSVPALIDLLTAKTAKELSLDLSLPSASVGQR